MPLSFLPVEAIKLTQSDESGVSSCRCCSRFGFSSCASKSKSCSTLSASVGDISRAKEFYIYVTGVNVKRLGCSRPLGVYRRMKEVDELVCPRKHAAEDMQKANSSKRE